MSHAVWIISYPLKQGVSEEEFLRASKRCHDEVLSRQKGFLSWDVLRDGDTWIDLVKWETAEDAKNGETAGAGDPAAKEFYSFINLSRCKLRLYSMEQSHRQTEAPAGAANRGMTKQHRPQPKSEALHQPGVK